MQRNLYILFFLIATILMAVRGGYAQGVPGMMAWPMDSVVNGSVHRYTVQGDENYTIASSFVWNVKGGTLFYDAAATQRAGTGRTDTVQGNALNQTTMYVLWDEFTTPLDTGFVYLYEISSAGCQYGADDPKRYSGLRIKVSAPPKVRFVNQITELCSYDSVFYVVVQIDGMPPFDLKYRHNGVLDSIHVKPSDLSDWDNDGKADNIAFRVDGFYGTTQPVSHTFELVEASSGGVPGEVLNNFRNHLLNIYVAPPKGIILDQYVEITTNTEKTFFLLDKGLNGETWFWSLNDASLNPIASHQSRDAYWTHNMAYYPGNYFLTMNYQDVNKCYSPYDTLAIEVFGNPTIRFSTNTPDNTGNCSALATIIGEKYEYLADMSFEFLVEYYGATHYNFTWCVKDYKGNKVVDDQVVNMMTMREFMIEVMHVFENTELPYENRSWTVEILNATNYEGINVEIIDGIRRIEIHPKPEIMDDIDFYN